jgi:hypothetical protein
MVMMMARFLLEGRMLRRRLYMAVADRKNPLAGADHREVMKQNSGNAPQAEVAARPVMDEDDYNGMPLEKWKAALEKDVEERFGSTPDDLVSAGKPGW